MMPELVQRGERTPARRSSTVGVSADQVYALERVRRKNGPFSVPWWALPRLCPAPITAATVPGAMASADVTGSPQKGTVPKVLGATAVITRLPSAEEKSDAQPICADKCVFVPPR
jgi:hypothetical protein